MFLFHGGFDGIWLRVDPVDLPWMQSIVHWTTLIYRELTSSIPYAIPCNILNILGSQSDFNADITWYKTCDLILGSEQGVTPNSSKDNDDKLINEPEPFANTPHYIDLVRSLCAHKHTHTYMYIYICMCICVRRISVKVI